MRKKTIKLAVAAAFGLVAVNAQAALTLTFANGTASAATAGACSAIGWTAGAEFRMCSPGDFLGGGVPQQKNAINGGETYSFNDAGQMTGVTGTPGNSGTTALGFGGGAAPTPGTNPTTQQGFAFGGVTGFNFLAPTLGSLAGTAYGAGTSLTSAPVNGTTTLMRFNVLEAQWGGAYFPLGSGGAGTGIDFIGTISGVSTVGLVTTFNFDVFANHTFAASEDPSPVGLTGWTAQWHQQGTGTYTAPVPIPAAVWLLGSGLLGLAGVARRKKLA